MRTAAIIVCSLLAASACKQSESTPIREGGTAASEQPHVDTEYAVKSSSGAVEVTLQFQKKMFARAEIPRFQIRLKNVGKNRIRLNDGIFFEPSAIGRQSRRIADGIRLEVLTSGGKPALTSLGDRHGDHQSDYDSATPKPTSLNARVPELWLEPGATAKMIGDGLQPVTFYILPIGKYTARVAYDRYISPAQAKKYGLTPSPEDVRTETPYIEFEILP